MATKPTEVTDWANSGSALKTATDSNRWNLGWQTLPSNLPNETGERPNLNQQNYWQNAVHNWSTYFDTQIDENLVTLGELLVTTEGIVAPSIPLDSAFNLADVNTMMAPYIAKYSGVESGVAALGTNHGIGGSWGPKAAFDPKSNRIYPSIVWNFGGGGTAMSYDFTIQKARQLNNFVANSDFYQSSEINLYVPAPFTTGAHPYEGGFIMGGTSENGKYQYTDTVEPAIREVAITGDVPTEFLFPAGYSPINRRVYFWEYGQVLGVNQQTFYYDLDTDDFVAVANVNLAGYEYSGGVYDPTNDRIYLIPRFAVQNWTIWHYIDCVTGLLVSYTGPDVNAGATQGYRGGALDPINNRIIMSPAEQGLTFHYIDLATTTVVSYAAAVLGTAADYVAPGAPCFSPATGRMYFSNNGSEVGYVYYIDCNVPTPVLTNYAHSTGNRLQIKEGMIYIPNTGMMVDSFTASSDWACVREVGVGDSPASITSNPQYN